ncbi:unnamed protein product, partial [Ixodes pacificus]
SVRGLLDQTDTGGFIQSGTPHSRREAGRPALPTSFQPRVGRIPPNTGSWYWVQLRPAATGWDGFCGQPNCLRIYPEGLQRRSDSLHTFVGARGLAINTENSFTVLMVPSGREKRTKVVTTGNFLVWGIPLPACGIEARWKYLGVEFSPNGRNVPLTKDVASMLERVAKAPLKPQQRLVILRFYLVPRLYHRLVLGRWNRKLLKRLDVQIQDAVRKWMALPHDTPLGYYHAPVNKGGLGVGSFSTAIPWMQVQRLSRMATSSSPICRQAADTYMVKTALGKAEKACVVRGNILSDKQSVGKHWSAFLHASNDG